MKIRRDDSENPNANKPAQIRKKRKKSRGKVIAVRIFAFIIIIAIIVVAALSVTVLFPISGISVTGKCQYSETDIIKASGIEKGKNLWLSGRDAVEKIESKLPYISNVKIERKIPSSIVIIVESAKAVKTYLVDKKYYLCDNSDKILEICDSLPNGTILLSGTTAMPSKAGNTVKFKDNNAHKLLNEILSGFISNKLSFSSIDITDSLDIKANVSDRFDVFFGSSANIKNKILHIKNMIDKIDKDAQGEIDMRLWSEANPEGIFKRK